MTADQPLYDRCRFMTDVPQLDVSSHWGISYRLHVFTLRLSNVHRVQEFLMVKLCEPTIVGTL